MSWKPNRSLRDPVTLQRLVDNLREGIYITNESGQILDANPAFLSMFEVGSLRELERYRTPELLVDPGERRRELEILHREGAVREYELQIRLPNGIVRTVLDTAFIVEDYGNGDTLFHGVLVDITRRKELERELREMSVRDALTGVYNRRHLGEIEQRLLSQHESWGAVVIDIDNFKHYNDQHGHAIGDQALVRVARFLSQSVRTEDTVVRLGGDEFVVVVALAEGKPHSTQVVVERMKARAPLACPVSFTLGWCNRQGSEPLSETIQRADQELIQIRVDERKRERRSSEPLGVAVISARHR